MSTKVVFEIIIPESDADLTSLLDGKSNTLENEWTCLAAAT